MNDKIIKDPIYGYISIDEDIVHDIIDKPEFQRLRYIRQTSYLPVYPAALHNRFTHSLGVYHLGKTAFSYIKKSSNITNFPKGISINRVEQIFILACLLHDIGHAPFSHSGERFYLSNGKNDDLIKELISCVDDNTFTKDLKSYKGKEAAPHEIMSAILGLTQFGKFFNNSTERSLFARCITGYVFINSNNKKSFSFYNSIISLLNSSTIDVDRMDYLIRDAFVMGYNSISIDYKRLLSSLMIIKKQDDTFCLAYNKTALSVIENVIYAHDIEKKWVQSHPIILYESFLINNIIHEVSDYYKKHTNGLNLFSLKSLLPNSNNDSSESNNTIGELINNSLSNINENCSAKELAEQLKSTFNNLTTFEPINLLCDDDIIYIAKKINSPFSQELFDRSLRRHPIWKSESEYKIFVDGNIGDNTYKKLVHQLEILDKFLVQESPTHCLDDETLNFCQKQLDDLLSSDLSQSDKDVMQKRYKLFIHWLEGFQLIANKYSIKNSFVIINTANFESSFKKIDLKKLQVYFSNNNRSYNLDEVISLFDVKDTSRREYFYIYYKRDNSSKIDLDSIGLEISKLLMNDILGY